MAFNVKLLAPTGVASAVGQFGTYPTDVNGIATITNPGDIKFLLDAGWTYLGVSAGRNNFAATTDPAPTNDTTQDYAQGSVWVNTSAGRVWTCSVATAGAARWAQVSQVTANFRNLLDGGDFTVNPFQRNIPGLASGGVISAAISNTVTYFADRFFGVGGASSAILFSVQSNTSVAGFNQALRFQRQSGNTNTAVITIGQILETIDSIRGQGQQITLSFWAAIGSNYSGGAITIQVVSGTGTNQSAASAVAGTWTGQANVINTTQVLTTTQTRYQFTGTVPANATQLGVLISYTPAGTAGTNDYIDFMGFQLEIAATASEFEHRDVEVELALCQRYAFVVPEQAAGVSQGAGGVATGTNAVNFTIALPTPMRAAPTVTVTVGSFKAHLGAAAVAATGLTGNATHTPTVIGLNCTATATAGQGAILEGGGGAGFIVASADF